jgi:hypothetical protein
VPHTPPASFIGQVPIDGGGIIRMPNGTVVHWHPPLPDPLPFAVPIEDLLNLTFHGRLAEQGHEAGLRSLRTVAESINADLKRIGDSLAALGKGV